MDYNEIQKHMINKFSNVEKIVELDDLPALEKIKELEDNKIYKTKLLCVAVDVINYKNLNKNTDIEVLSKIMSEYVYGVTKIMKEYGGTLIDIQGDGIFCVLSKSNTKEWISKGFSMLCALNSFRIHLQKMLKNILVIA